MQRDGWEPSLGVTATWGPGPGTGQKVTEVGRAREIGTGGTKRKALGKGRVLPKTPTLILVLCLEGRVLPLGLLWPLPKDSLLVPPVPVSLALPTSVTFYPVPGPGPHVTLTPKLSSQLSLCMNGTLEIARKLISQVSSGSGGSHPRASIHASLPLSAWTTTDQPSRLLRPPFPQVFFPKPLSHPALCPQPG